MEVLAEASLGRSRVLEDDAAQILNLLRTQSRTSPAPSDDEAYPPSPRSESTAETQQLEAPPARPWASNEDELLRRLAVKAPPHAGHAPSRPGAPDSNAQAWEEISQQFEDRTSSDCVNRWQKVLNPENIKGPWCANEDAQLVELVRQYGGKHWARIASMLPGRTGKQCRERWCNNLDPTLKKGAWTPEEDMIILEMHAKLGTRWAEIAKSLPGRSDNSVKNRWYSTCSRILRQQQEAADHGHHAAALLPQRRSSDMIGYCEEQLPDDDDSFEAHEHLPVEAEASRPSTPNRGHAHAAPPKRSSRAVVAASPRKRKAAAAPPAAPTPQKRPGSAGRATAAVSPAAHDLKEPTWRVGSRSSARGMASAQQKALKLPGSWSDLAVKLPQPGESVGEPALSAEIY